MNVSVKQINRSLNKISRPHSQRISSGSLLAFSKLLPSKRNTHYEVKNKIKSLKKLVQLPKFTPTSKIQITK